MALNTQPHLASRLKKEDNYTSTPPIGLRGVFWGEIYLFTVTFYSPWVFLKKALGLTEASTNSLFTTKTTQLLSSTFSLPNRCTCTCCLEMLGILSLNPLNAKLNPICPLLALLGAHHILHVSRVRVKMVPSVHPSVRTKQFYNG